MAVAVAFQPSLLFLLLLLKHCRFVIFLFYFCPFFFSYVYVERSELSDFNSPCLAVVFGADIRRTTARLNWVALLSKNVGRCVYRCNCIRNELCQLAIDKPALRAIARRFNHSHRCGGVGALSRLAKLCFCCCWADGIRHRSSVCRRNVFPLSVWIWISLCVGMFDCSSFACAYECSVHAANACTNDAISADSAGNETFINGLRELGRAYGKKRHSSIFAIALFSSAVCVTSYRSFCGFQFCFDVRRLLLLLLLYLFAIVRRANIRTMSSRCCTLVSRKCTAHFCGCEIPADPNTTWSSTVRLTVKTCAICALAADPIEWAGGGRRVADNYERAGKKERKRTAIKKIAVHTQIRISLSARRVRAHTNSIVWRCRLCHWFY